ncbi:unnamed protein product [Linum trigynum]|uniref:Uncharacterized protein n=1 Tax=Linum trigynum TaxID=586398 RepID=A0AAV2GAS3_9ROSI
MPAVATPLASGGPPSSGKPDFIAGQHCPPPASSSPNPKGDREAQQSKKRAKPTIPTNDVESAADGMTVDVEMGEKQYSQSSPKLAAWSSGMEAARRLFSDLLRPDAWYIADSDSEDVAAGIREDGMEVNEEGDDDPVCLTIKFSTIEE